MESLEKTQKVEEEEGEEEKPDKKVKKEHNIGVVSMTMNNAGNLIYAGCTDNIIRVFEISEKKA
jgi:hypothetical protein